MNQPLVWMNGAYTNYSEARIPIEDRGFQFSDGIYEVVRAVDGYFFAMEEHLRRLRRSLKAIEIELSWSDQEIRCISEDLLSRSGELSASLYIQVTRGVAPRSHAFPSDPHPTVILLVRRYDTLDEAYHRKGAFALTLKDERWLRCDIKTLGLLANVLAKERAKRAQVLEAIFIRDGWVTEGTSSNVFLVNPEGLITPPADHHILHGVTRAKTIELARKRNLHVVERRVGKEELFKAQEVFLTSTTFEIMPLVEIDGRPVGAGQPGEVTQRLQEDYGKLLRQHSSQSLMTGA